MDASSAQAGAQPLVRFDAVSKRFGGVTAVDRLTLDIHASEFFALLGPSGCGKTTLLRMLAGFGQPDEGRILLDGEDISNMPPYERPVNMMFQSYALFPHLTVSGNIAFGLKQEGMARADIRRRVEELLSLVRLDEHGKRYPHQLSGGQRQRVALARSLAKRPKVLLLDEPMAALDKKLREDTQFELTRLQEQLGTTFIIVTHDQEEAMTVADRIAVMNRGRLMQVAPPSEIYERPNSCWVADFIGDVNLLEGLVQAADASAVVITDGSGQRFRFSPSDGVSSGMKVSIAIRPEKLSIAASQPGAQENCLSGTVSDIAYRGNALLYRVRASSGAEFKVSVMNTRRLAGMPVGKGDQVWLTFAPEAGVVLRD